MTQLPPSTRHGKRAEGTSVLQIPMPTHLKEDIVALAKLDDRMAAPWARKHLAEAVRRSKAARK